MLKNANTVITFVSELTKASTTLISWCFEADVSCFALIVGTDFHFCYKQSYFINFGSSKVGAETYGINSDTLWGISSRCSTSKGKGNVLDEIET